MGGDKYEKLTKPHNGDFEGKVQGRNRVKWSILPLVDITDLGAEFRKWMGTSWRYWQKKISD